MHINFRQWNTNIFLQSSFQKYRISQYVSPLQISPSPHISPCCFFYHNIFMSFEASFKAKLWVFLPFVEKYLCSILLRGFIWLSLKIWTNSWKTRAMESQYSKKVYVSYLLHKRTYPRNVFLAFFFTITIGLLSFY